MSIDYAKYWQQIEDPMHGHTDNLWPEKYAKEVFFHLKSSDKVFVDTGCGTGDILRYLAHRLDRIYGIDFSPGMLERAKSRLADLDNVKLYCDNMLNVNKLLPEKADVIFNNHSLQYLTYKEVDQLIKNCDEVLKKDGRLFFFNVPDKNKRWLFALEFYWTKKEFTVFKLFKSFLVKKYNDFKNFVKNSPKGVDDGVGYWFIMDELEKLANQNGFDAEFTYSLYPPYGYRFNIIMKRQV